MRADARGLTRLRALHGTGYLLIGAILAGGAIVGPASACERAPLHRGGDMIPFFCVDHGAAWAGWPLLLAGLSLLVIGMVQLHRAASGTRLPTTLHAALLLGALGAALLYGAWSEGSASVCTTTFHDSAAGAPSETSCAVRPEPWRDAALVAGGALVGAGATLGAAVAVRAAQGSGTGPGVAAR